MKTPFLRSLFALALAIGFLALPACGAPNYAELQPIDQATVDVPERPDSTTSVEKKKTLEEICDELHALQNELDMRALDASLEPPSVDRDRRIAGLRHLSNQIGRFRAENC